MPLFQEGRSVHVAPEDAVVIAHLFVKKCKAWGESRGLPESLQRYAAQPTSGHAARIHAWSSFVEMLELTLQELENGDLDSWFQDPPR